MTTDISVKVGTLTLESPVIPASGVWPYAEEFWREPKLEGVGALCTKAISLDPRRGNRGVRIWETPSGILNSIGLQNIGAAEFVSHYSELVKNCPRPVIANVVMERPSETQETLSIISDVEGIAAAELNISCPNVDGEGMAWGMQCTSAAEAVRAVRSAWKGQLWVKMTPQTPEPAEVARAIEAEGADAIVCANTWLGMAIDPYTCKPAFNRVTAGFSGPAVYPLALRLLWQVAEAVSIPVVGCGGVTTPFDCIGMIAAGASAV
ncbi:MAG: dihydroorotate dehydrogenase, partial [Synergistes sp.]|nr:dihydroorotate dehydrogenase [Synergistes sp.]